MFLDFLDTSKFEVKYMLLEQIEILIIGKFGKTLVEIFDGNYFLQTIRFASLFTIIYLISFIILCTIILIICIIIIFL